MAEELQPDLIVMDIGLPKLNGIEAARRIQKLSPKSKILFVSQESSADVAREALSAGAMGYVVKACAGSELLSAVGAVLEDNQFISSGLSGDHFTAAASAVTALDSIFPNQAFPSLVPENTEISRAPNANCRIYVDISGSGSLSEPCRGAWRNYDMES